MPERDSDRVDRPPLDVDQRTLLGVMAHLAAAFGPPDGDIGRWAAQIRDAALGLLSELPRLEHDHATFAATRSLTGEVLSIDEKTLGPVRRGYIMIRPDVGRYDDTMWTDPLDTPAGRDQYAQVADLIGRRVAYDKVTVNRGTGRGYGRLQRITANDS